MGYYILFLAKYILFHRYHDRAGHGGTMEGVWCGSALGRSTWVGANTKARHVVWYSSPCKVARCLGVVLMRGPVRGWISVGRCTYCMGARRPELCVASVGRAPTCHDISRCTPNPLALPQGQPPGFGGQVRVQGRKQDGSAAGAVGAGFAT